MYNPSEHIVPTSGGFCDYGKVINNHFVQGDKMVYNKFESNSLIMENTRHHRKCRSLRGNDTARNISHVPQLHHRAWHNLFGNLSAPQVAHQLCRLFPDYHFLVVPTVPMKNIVLSTNPGTAKSRKLIDKSIQILWGDMGMQRIVDNINERWLDRDFRLIHLKIVSP